ncbi:MAG: phage major capsid protein [Butyricicoccaceae bacterium]
MRRKIINLKQQRKTILDKAEAALATGNAAEFDAQMAEADRLQNEIDNYERLIAARGDFDDHDTGMVDLHNAQQQAREENSRRSQADNIRSSREYARRWASAIKAGLTPTRAQDSGVEEARVLLNVLTLSGGDPVGSDGGFIAPLDFDNMIHEREKEYLDLSTLFATESVSAMSGWRAVATASSVALPKIEEGATIGKTSQPSFEKVSYAISKYGDRIAVSRELLNAEPGILMSYISRWFAPRYVLTKNTLLLELLNNLSGIEVTAGGELSAIKTALNVTLNTAHSKGASILTNQSGYNTLDQLTDSHGRPLLVPNPADPDTYQLKGKPIRFADDDLIPIVSSAYPIYIGKFSAFGTLFERTGFEIASTDIGGDAWATASPEIRAMTFLDAQQVDEKAVVKLSYSPAAESSAEGTT